jgi:hypothetical protein
MSYIGASLTRAVGETRHCGGIGRRNFLSERGFRDIDIVDCTFKQMPPAGTIGLPRLQLRNRQHEPRSFGIDRGVAPSQGTTELETPIEVAGHGRLGGG